MRNFWRKQLKTEIEYSIGYIDELIYKVGSRSPTFFCPIMGQKINQLFDNPQFRLFTLTAK